LRWDGQAFKIRQMGDAKRGKRRGPKRIRIRGRLTAAKSTYIQGSAKNAALKVRFIGVSSGNSTKGGEVKKEGERPSRVRSN